LRFAFDIKTGVRDVVWLSGNALVSINVVSLHRARLIFGWVTVCGRVNHLGITSHLGQLSVSSFRCR